MKLNKQVPLLILCILPIIYLGYIWEDLPEQIPTHWNIKGEIDSWSNKNSSLFITAFPIIIFIIMTLIPKIDPKKKITQMGNKYTQFKFIIVAFTSILAISILYIAKEQNTESFQIELIIGMLFMALGNYFQAIKHNYFIGIRTPWTLESESVWKKTHQLGGKLWIAGGLLIIMSSLALSKEYSSYTMLFIISIITIMPITYSYFEFKKEKQI